MTKRKVKPDPKALAENVWGTGWTYIRNVVDTAREPFLILDEKLAVMAANESFYRTFDATASETEGKFVYDLGNGQWAGTHLRKLLDDILPEKNFFRDFEIDHHFPVVGHRIFLLNARQVFTEDGKFPRLIILAMEDVTKQRMVEMKLAEYSKELEKKVTERTEQLSTRIEQLEQFTKMITGREVKMIELKKEIENLKKQLKDRK